MTGFVHGRLGYRRGCTCTVCRDAYNAYRRELRAANAALKLKPGVAEPPKKMVLAGLVEQPGWMVEASCTQVDPELFFPGKGASAKDARAVCEGCPVAEECLKAAMDRSEKWGVWGGVPARSFRKVAAEVAS